MTAPQVEAAPEVAPDDECAICGDAPMAGSAFCSVKCEAIAEDRPYGSEVYADL